MHTRSHIANGHGCDLDFGGSPGAQQSGGTVSLIPCLIMSSSQIRTQTRGIILWRRGCSPILFDQLLGSSA